MHTCLGPSVPADMGMQLLKCSCVLVGGRAWGCCNAACLVPVHEHGMRSCLGLKMLR